MKRILILLVVILFTLVGCTQDKIKDNQVYVVEDNPSSEGENVQNDLVTKGLIPFEEYEYSNEDEEYGQILLTISPDSNYKYYMEIEQNTKKHEMIKGANIELVKIIKVNIKNQEEKVIAESVPFISQVKWNKDGTIVGFCGGDRLTIYDTINSKLLLEEKLLNDEISYFAWSPKEVNKLYTEQSSLANGSIYYTDLQKKLESYETKEDIYYKGNLDNRYHYATKWFVVDEKDKLKTKRDSINTVVVNDKGLIVKGLGEGRFRDSYKKSVVKIGENGFGLYYIKDINNPGKTKKLTKEYIYDVKFVGDGKIAYLVDDKDINKNYFLLKIIDKNGNFIDEFEVSGGNLALAPNGKTGYIGGPLLEKINFETNEISYKRNINDYNQEKNHQAKVFRTIRGAMDTLYQFELSNKKSYEAVEEYYIDSLSPEQWAYFDLSTNFKENNALVKEEAYNLEILIKEVKDDFKTNKASYLIRVEAKDATGQEQVREHSLELLKKDNNWYVTGMSTFPDSKERYIVERIVNKYVVDAQKGKLFPKVIEDKEVSVGQVQFWSASMPHLASKVSNASYAKVYLIVGNQKEEIYKLVLEKKNKTWKPIALEKENLSSLLP
ncbi:hypothetical protein SAMN00017405_1350 [Desulfonispora thiosulfatigenes DSM 11270]|uniref:Lipoprotein n=1 Tax=Desulfonispora thiosulfatigenes DSM 11270 TaxID=656914 RepID=A0A1W1VCL3_DESTI|nr:hypothetical protein [Desulfonispora thiosulfatigenes]SMB90704.1 hypothetical protein SAMN00017405_1350 [Desulfonispora thiosulfatigenes DSM 11270]